MKLNLGCGPVQPSGWINADGSNRAWLASRLPWLDRLLVILHLIDSTEFNKQTFYVDLLCQLPWKDRSVDVIYMGEILEHFTREEGEKVLRECYRILKPSGILRLRVPDNAFFWANYVKEYEQVKKKPRSQWSLNHARWIEMFFKDVCINRPKIWQSIGHYHKWMYDEVSLTLLIESIGFNNVQRKAFRQSAISQIEDVEIREDLIIEAVR